MFVSRENAWYVDTNWNIVDTWLLMIKMEVMKLLIRNDIQISYHIYNHIVEQAKP